MTTPPISRDSNDWRPLKSWLITRIHEYQNELEQPGVGERESDTLRGRIAAYRAIIKEVEPDKLIEREKLEDAPVDRAVDY